MKFEKIIQFYPGDRGDFIKVIEERCTGCGQCAKFCTMDIWSQIDKIYKPLKIEECVECGACWNVCNSDAIIFRVPKGGTGVKFTHG